VDIAADLPSVDGTAVQLDSLISEPGTWRVYLRARPGWWTLSADRHRKWAAMSVQAEDDLGGRYLRSSTAAPVAAITKNSPSGSGPGSTRWPKT